MKATTIQMVGAGGFGAVIGWFVYYVTRYTKQKVKLTDITVLIGAIGGSAVLTLFKNGTDLFGAYGIGLMAGYFLYFVSLVIFVGISDFTYAWFLDGRRPKLGEFIEGTGQQPMLDQQEHQN